MQCHPGFSSRINVDSTFFFRMLIQGLSSRNNVDSTLKFQHWKSVTKINVASTLKIYVDSMLMCPLGIYVKCSFFLGQPIELVREKYVPSSYIKNVWV